MMIRLFVGHDYGVIRSKWINANYLTYEKNILHTSLKRARKVAEFFGDTL